MNINELAYLFVFPGLSLTHNQLFFLSFSQVWCSKSTPQHLKLQVTKKSGTNNDYLLKSLSFRFPLGPERPPQPGEVPGDWRALQLEGVRRGLPVQRGNQDEPRAQVRGLVVEIS